MKGGDKFEARLREIAEGLSKASTLRVGFMENSTYALTGVSVPLVAAIQEFGSPSRNIPPRPFMRKTVATHSNEWPELISHLLKMTDYDAEKTLLGAGDVIKEQVQQSIVDFDDVPLAPATIKKKGSSKQLIQTGTLLRAVAAEVS